jgi:hypothetical protein
MQSMSDKKNENLDDKVIYHFKKSISLFFFRKRDKGNE